MEKTEAKTEVLNVESKKRMMEIKRMIKCSWRNCKEQGYYFHDLLIKGREFQRFYCTYHHRIAKEHELKKGYRWENDS